MPLTSEQIATEGYFEGVLSIAARGLLAELFEEIMGYEYGGSTFSPTWLASQAERDRLLRDDEDMLNLITTLVTTGMIDGTSMQR